MEYKNNTFIIRVLIRYFKSLEIKFSNEEVNSGWETVVREGERRKKRNRQHRIYALAGSASVAACLIFVFILRMVSTEESNNIADVMAQFSEVSMVGDSIQLIVSDKNIIPLKKGAIISYTAKGAISVDKEKIKEGEKSQFNQIVVPKGKYAQLLLADGSYLHINAGTKVVYPCVFEKNKREIFVDGEIYIDVKHDEAAPFIVKTAKFDVRVLGTAFNVNAYSENDYSEVVLLRGKVKIKDQLNEKMELLPNQLASIRNGVIEEKHAVNAKDYVAWTRGQLIIDSERVENVLRRLEYYYGIKITSDPAVRELMISGSLDLNCSLEEVLKRLSVATNIEYQAVSSGFYVKKR